jgi:hypothetical protein
MTSLQPGQGENAVTIGINKFVRERQTRDSKFSHFEGTWQELIEQVEMNFEHAVEGYRPGVLLVPVGPLRFMSSIVPVDDETPLEATFGSRREGEESHLGIVSTGGKKAPAKRVDIVLYHRDVLLEDDDVEDVGPEEWQVISINASPSSVMDVPFAPVARARNILGMKGGTDAKLEELDVDELLALVKDMARATIFWSQHVMVEPLQADTVEVGDRYQITTDGKGGASIEHGDDNGRQDSGDPLFDELIHAGLTGMETLLTSLAKIGVKVGGPRFRAAVEDAVREIGVHSFVQRKHSKNAPK